IDSFRGKDDVDRHSGQIIARFAGSSKESRAPGANDGAAAVILGCRSVLYRSWRAMQDAEPAISYRCEPCRKLLTSASLARLATLDGAPSGSAGISAARLGTPLDKGSCP